MLKMNEFEKICYKFEKCKRGCRRSEIMCARKILEIHINKNYDTFLKIKAESKKSDDKDFRNTVLAFCALLISVCSVIIAFCSLNESRQVIGNIFVFSIFIIMSFFIYKANRFNFVARWAEYVKIILDEIEINKDYFK